MEIETPNPLLEPPIGLLRFVGLLVPDYDCRQMNHKRLQFDFFH